MTLAAFLSVVAFLAKHHPDIAAFLERITNGDATELEKLRATLKGNTAREWLEKRDPAFRGVLAPPPDTTPGSNFPSQYEEP